MQAQIRAVAGYEHSVVTYNGGTDGHVGIIFLDSGDSPVVTTVTWDDTTLRDLLGFTATLSGNSEYESTYIPRYVWYPSRPVSDHPGDLATWWAPTSNSRAFRGHSGYTSAAAGNALYDGLFEYTALDEDETIIASTSTGWNRLEQFWLDVPHNAMPFRCFYDRTATYTSSAFKTAMWAPLSGNTLGSWQNYRERFVKEYQGLWDAKLPLWKHVT